MSQKEPLKKVGSVKLEPLRGQRFDIQPPATGTRLSHAYGAKDYGRFALVGFLAFVILNFGNAYVQGKDLIYDSKQQAYAGYENLKRGANELLNQNTEGASKAFTEAQMIFEQMRASTDYVTSQANQFSDESLYLDTLNTLLESALEVSEIGQKLSDLTLSFKEFPTALLSPNADPVTVTHEKKDELTRVIDLATALQQKLTHLNLGILPQALEINLRSAQEHVGQFLAILLKFDHYLQQLLTLLGDEVPHRYLILFQNNNEIRATGGFIGSYMIVEVNDGKITKMEAKDIYESDGQLGAVVAAPPGIDQVADRLYMRDANYSPDFPTSARQIMWFLEAAKGPSIDTVVAIDQTVVESILKLTGEIKVPTLPYPVNAQNFSSLISFFTEAKFSQTHTPKQFLFDMIPLFKEELGKVERVGDYLKFAEAVIHQGHIQAYSADPSLQSLLEEFGLAGKMIQVDEQTDYLSVIRTSIGGNKSDRFINVDLKHQTFIEQNNEVIDELTIKKTHSWGKKQVTELENLIAEFGTGKLSKETLYYILGRGPNKDYMRVYVPLGSELESVSGISMDQVTVSQDLGYTVFGFVDRPVSAGTSNEIQLRYKLPFEMSFRPLGTYRFVGERQAGESRLRLEKTFQATDELRIEEQYPEVPINGSFDQTVIFAASLSN